jgi:hypothetical protein
MGPSRVSLITGDNRPRHTSEIRKFPMLGAAAEQARCQRWRDYHDISAAHHLAGSCLYLVVKIAARRRDGPTSCVLKQQLAFDAQQFGIIVPLPATVHARLCLIDHYEYLADPSTMAAA